MGRETLSEQLGRIYKPKQPDDYQQVLGVLGISQPNAEEASSILESTLLGRRSSSTELPVSRFAPTAQQTSDFMQQDSSGSGRDVPFDKPILNQYPVYNPLNHPDECWDKDAEDNLSQSVPGPIRAEREHDVAEQKRKDFLQVRREESQLLR